MSEISKTTRTERRGKMHLPGEETLARVSSLRESADEQLTLFDRLSKGSRLLGERRRLLLDITGQPIEVGAFGRRTLEGVRARGNGGRFALGGAFPLHIDPSHEPSLPLAMVLGQLDLFADFSRRAMYSGLAPRMLAALSRRLHDVRAEASRRDRAWGEARGKRVRRARSNDTSKTGLQRSSRTVVVLSATAAVAVAAAVVSGGALAFWSASGGGSGSGSAGTPDPVTITPGVPTQLLYPGGSADVALSMANGNPSAVFIGSLELDTAQGAGGFAVDSGHSGCDVGALSYATQSNGGAGWSVPASSTLDLDLAGAVTLGTGALSACQGATFTVYLKAVT